ncbi:alpha/beta hydrolase family protein [Botrimarina hoheduenensis]|uniref:Esterase n=1 Tax=Botrimarina hoheduenensis TaxID=2528000 RepID=A0A5C5W851_9BACT|nr:alpha/beta hydrolase-fold protein [Botrimarina hoheduenensis]TWT46627.1 hypothetical protein Pla111_17280 [Botrimarina hoheduenensis]
MNSPLKWRAETLAGQPVWWTIPTGAPPLMAAIVLHELPNPLDLPPNPLTPAVTPPESAPPNDAAAWAAELVPRGVAVIVPWSGASWWTDGPVFGPEHKPGHVSGTLIAAVAWIRAELGLAPPQIALVGSGMGGHAALRWAYLRPQVFAAAAALRPWIDWHTLLDRTRADDPQFAALHTLYNDPEQARQDSATLHIHPLNWPRRQRFDCPPGDPRHEGADRLRMKLMSLGVPHQCELEQRDGPDYDSRRIAAASAWLVG